MNTADTRDQPRAYSYLRFSTPAQAAGDSLRRQTEKAVNYAVKHDLILDTELKLRDEGRSGYDGTNARIGALAAFLAEVKSKTVPRGSYLLIENVDRLTRADLPDAMELFWGLINSGIVVVTVSDEQRYSRESLSAEPWAVYAIVSELIRGNRESAVKGERVARAYEQKRRDARNGKLFTRMLPPWLRWNEDTAKIEAVPSRANIVRTVYEMTAQGRSPQRIAQTLNEQGITPWGRAGRKAAFWYQSYVRKLLSTSAVVGTYVPRKVTKDGVGRKRRTPLGPIEGYYPAVVDQDLFEQVAARMRTTAARGRNADVAPKSIFAGVMKCARCGGTITRISKGEYVYLVCAKAHAKAGCKYEAVPYQMLEQRFVEVADGIIDEAPRGKDTTELDREIEGYVAHTWRLADQARDFADLWQGDKDEGARRQWQQKEQELEHAEQALRVLKTRRDGMASETVTRKLGTLRAALGRKPLDVVEANKAMRASIGRIEMNAEQGWLTIHWQHSEDTSAIFFVSKHTRWENG